MSKKFATGIPVKYKYQSVKYFPFQSVPGASYVLSSDPWSYLFAWFDTKIKSSSGDKKKRYIRAKYFTEQAESFQIAADKTRLPTKATLCYYSMLNLIKAYLSSTGLELEKKMESHGISLTDNDYQLRIQGNTSSVTNIFFEFCKVLGSPIIGQSDLLLENIYSDIPEIHEMVFTLGKVQKRKFLPVEINILTNESLDKAFTEIKFKKGNDARLPIEKFHKLKREEYFNLKSNNEKGYIEYRSKKRKSYTRKNFPAIYKNICKEINNLEMASILTRDGYRYYINLNPNGFHHLANSVLLMFYMGTAARYRPTITQEIMSGAIYPIMAEAVEICPKQFLYQIASYVTNNVCAVPKSKI